MTYSMKQLEAITGKPAQTIHRLIRDNDDLIALLPEHRIKSPNNRNVYYDDVILNFLKDYFDVKAPDTKDIPNTDNLLVNQKYEILIDEMKQQIEELEQQLESKEKIIADLEKSLSDKEAERIHFVTQNGQLMALLISEKQEKQRLLPPPRKPIVERIKNIFSRTKEEGENVE